MMMTGVGVAAGVAVASGGVEEAAAVVEVGLPTRGRARCPLHRPPTLRLPPPPRLPPVPRAER